MDNQKELSQKLAQLRGDIFLAEKQKERLLEELTQLQNTKSKAVEEYVLPVDKKKNEAAQKTYQELQGDIEHLQKSKEKTALELENQIKKKKLEIEIHTIEGKRLSTLVGMYSMSLVELKKARSEQEKSNFTDIQKAHESVLHIYQLAKGVREEADIERKKIKVSALAVTLRAVNITKMLYQLSQGNGQLERKQAIVERERQELATEKKKINLEIEVNSKLLEDINRQLPEKQMMLKNLDEFIEKRKKESEKIGILETMRLAEANHLYSGVARKDKVLHEKEIKLIEKERWLADRESSLSRAYRETIQRGGKVNN